MMRRFSTLIFLALLIFATSAWAADWRPISERRDFEVKNPEALLERTYQILKDWAEEAGPEPFDVERARKSASHILSLHVKEYDAEAVLVLIEDREVGEPDAYEFMLYEAPAMEPVSWGAVLITEPFDQWLKPILEVGFDPEFQDGL